MLSNIVKNSHKLVNSQLTEDQQLLNQIIRLKNKRINFSYFQPSHKRGSIFEEPEFSPNINLTKIKRNNRSYLMSQSTRVRSNSEGVEKDNKSITLRKIPKQKQNEKIKFCLDKTIDNEQNSKIIHSWRNNKCLISNKNPKIHHERVYADNNKFLSNRKMIEQPGFVNLCFYKNTLQQIQSIRTVRTSTRKRSNMYKVDKQKMNRNKIKYIKYKGFDTNQNPQCRPWSPQRDSDQNCGQFLNLKSLNIKLET